MQTFRLSGLPPSQFSHLFQLSDPELADRGIRRVIADAQPGFPCRVSLSDAAPGEELLLLPYTHQPANSPYRASGPIFVRRGAEHQRIEPPGHVPPYVATRLISLRAYDQAHTIVHAEVVAGTQAGEAIERVFGGNVAVSYVHLHNAREGCFFCLAERVEARRRPGGA